MSKRGILVTGGAGYIGSHVVKQLGPMGERLVIIDNLSTGFRDSVLHGDFVEGDTGDMELVSRVLREYDVESVIHFAAHTIVPESVENPLKYYGNNTCKTRNLLECCQKAGVKHFIFSSTAATYGIPEGSLCTEDTPTSPINPYGMSKLMSETMLRDLSLACDLRHVILRYFNVAGSDPDGQIGQSTKNATLLIKVAAEVAVGKREKLYVFGTDYPTADGTGVRDYIHVSDLADAHIQALDYLRHGGQSTLLNCGYGHGYSVREVINAVNRVHGSPITVQEQPRRAGDPPALVAAVDKIHRTLKWKPRFDDLEFIVKTSLEWEKQLLARV
ncbi:UDP-glucose 4-epimerase GalE [Methyloterricola oryzae]|uniref:UDP-glucose 4-epimerase GalE n=1 Tax=Methyloterricola oryzae TaxID=1495050 RepID=UPI0005EBDC1A|nr:UDP-glucose 4-epimerase GalE [Methyloterricola oryzae]